MAGRGTFHAHNSSSAAMASLSVRDLCSRVKQACSAVKKDDARSLQERFSAGKVMYKQYKPTLDTLKESTLVDKRAFFISGTKQPMDPGPMKTKAEVRNRLCELSRNARDLSKWERLGWSLDADDEFEWMDEMTTGMPIKKFLTAAASAGQFSPQTSPPELHTRRQEIALDVEYGMNAQREFDSGHLKALRRRTREIYASLDAKRKNVPKGRSAFKTHSQMEEDLAGVPDKDALDKQLANLAVSLYRSLLSRGAVLSPYVRTCWLKTIVPDIDHETAATIARTGCYVTLNPTTIHSGEDYIAQKNLPVTNTGALRFLLDDARLCFSKHVAGMVEND